MSRVVCAGHVNWDVTFYVDVLPAADAEAHIHSRREDGGGSAANVATALVDLGVDAGVVGAVGDDEPGRTVRGNLQRRGVDVSALRSVEGGDTSEKYLVVDEDGRAFVMGNDGVNEALTPADVGPDLIGEADHLHLTGQRPETAVALADLAAEAGASVSIDPGRRVAERDFSAAFERVDLVFMNRTESRAVREPVVSGDGALVVTYGDEGATARVEGTQFAHPGFSVRAVDATGAGDAFAAGFLAIRLDGGDFDRALAFGNACGAIATEQHGARAELDRDRVEAMLSPGGDDG